MSSNYTGKNIKVLDDIEAIRQRFGMYAGSIETAAHHLVNEIIDNSVDEYLNNYADTIWVNYNDKENRITIIDNGRGLPIDIHPEEKIPTMEVLLTSTHSGGKFDKDSFKVSSGLNGVGSTVVNALSSKFDVISIRDGYEYSMSFEEGRKVKEFSKRKITKENKHLKNGTIVSFIPDKNILKKYAKLNIKLIEEDISIRSYINSGLKIILNDTKEFFHKDGIKEMVKDIASKNSNGKLLSDIYYFKDENKSQGNVFEIALAYMNNSNENIYSFANGIKTNKGTHESGFKKGITDSIKSFITDNNLLARKGVKIKDIIGEDIRSGIIAIINVRYANAEYSAQTKDELTNPELFGILGTFTNDNITTLSNKNKDQFKKICDRIIAFTKGRIKASQYKQSVVKVNNTSMGLADNGKFVDCFSKEVDERELLIVEGDSAGSAIKQARDPKTQALFPLRGKILNTVDLSHEKILKNVELNNLLVSIFGTNDLNKIDVKNTRFSKIIFLCDADVDGLNINALLTLFFFKFLPDLFLNDNIYIALPPKYRYQNNKGKFFYLRSDKELADFEYEQVKKDIIIDKTSGITLRKLMDIKKSYKLTFNNIIHQYSISPSIFSNITIPNEDEETIEDIINKIPELDYNINDDHVTGIFDEQWHDFYGDDIVDEAIKLSEIIELENKIKFTYKGKKMEEMYPIDFLNFIDDNYLFKYSYFKGLGEADASELYDTTIGPKRDIIKLNLEDFKETDDLLNTLFRSSETENRRKLMRSYLNRK